MTNLRTLLAIFLFTLGIAPITKGQGVSVLWYGGASGVTEGLGPEPKELYGTTQGKVSSICPSGCGAVVSTYTGIADASTTTIYEFTGGADGAGPIGPLVVDSAGMIYGVTDSFYAGLAGAPGVNGTIFRLVPSLGNGTWALQTLYSGPVNPGLVIGPRGEVYATNPDGVFELSFAKSSRELWQITPLASAPPGTIIQGTLVRDRKGVLYGATYGGGNVGSYGAVFSLSPVAKFGAPVVWNYNVIFGGFNEGFPKALTLGTDGQTIFGITSADIRYCPAPAVAGPTLPGRCGTVFSLADTSSGWTLTILHEFAGPGDGAYPYETLSVRNDPAYGITIFGSTAFGGFPLVGYPADTEGVGSSFRLVQSPNSAIHYNVFSNSDFRFGGDLYGQVLADIQGDGSYVAGTNKVTGVGGLFDVSFPLNVPAGTVEARLASGQCVNWTPEPNGDVTFKNNCNREAWFWYTTCAISSNPSSGCAEVPTTGFLAANQSLDLVIPTLATLLPFALIWECPAGTYPFFAEYSTSGPGASPLPECGPVVWQ